jgi:hypothetical protein
MVMNILEANLLSTSVPGVGVDSGSVAAAGRDYLSAGGRAERYVLA